MVKKTNTTKKENNVTAKSSEAQVAVLDISGYTANDMKNAVLGVSLFINAFIFTAWLTMQVTDRYNADVIAFLIR